MGLDHFDGWNQIAVETTDGRWTEVLISAAPGKSDIVLIPPLMPHAVYAELAEFLAKEFRVICCTTRGLHGRYEFDERNFGLADHVADIVAVLDRLDFAQPPSLFGWCLGAMIAIGVARVRPASIRHLLLAAPPLGNPAVSGVPVTQGAKGMSDLAGILWRDESLAGTLLEMTLKNAAGAPQSAGVAYARAQANAVFAADPDIFRRMFLLHHQVYQDPAYFGWLAPMTMDCDVLLTSDDAIVPVQDGVRVAELLGEGCGVQVVDGDHYSVLVDSAVQQRLIEMTHRPAYKPRCEYLVGESNALRFGSKRRR